MDFQEFKVHMRRRFEEISDLLSKYGHDGAVMAYERYAEWEVMAAHSMACDGYGMAFYEDIDVPAEELPEYTDEHWVLLWHRFSPDSPSRVI